MCLNINIYVRTKEFTILKNVASVTIHFCEYETVAMFANLDSHFRDSARALVVVLLIKVMPRSIERQLIRC